MVAVDLRATVGTRGLGDRRPEVDGYLPSYLRNREFYFPNSVIPLIPSCSPPEKGFNKTQLQI